MPLPLQTFWTTDDPAAGWFSEEFHAYSWALSAHSLATHAGGAVLHTTARGADWLLGELDLPYTEVVLSQESYQPPHAEAWVMRKLRTYALQTEAFVHLDGDAYLFAPLPASLTEAPLLAQNLEYDHPYYLDAVHTVADGFPYLPPWARPKAGESVWAVNAGLMGGQSVSFFKKLYAEAEAFLRHNTAQLRRLDNLALNTYLEQYLFKQLADFTHTPITPLLPDAVGYPYTYGLDKFALLPEAIGYLHLMNYKQNPTVCEQLAQRLWLEAPQLHERCQKAIRRASQSRVYFSQHPPNGFERTREALRVALSLPEATTLDSEQANLDSLATESGNDCLLDAYEYEKARMEFEKQLPDHMTMLDQWKESSARVNDLLLSGLVCYQETTLEFGPGCMRHGSSWNWAEAGEFRALSEAGSFVENQKLAPAYYETLFYYTPHLGRLREQPLDALSILLLDEVEEGSTWKSIVRQTTQSILEYQPHVDRQELSARIEERLRYFLYLGIVKINTET
jgi:hypothetical protein